MRSIKAIEERLTALAYAGRSYAGMDRAVADSEAARAVDEFEANAAEDLAWLLSEYKTLQRNVIARSAELIDASRLIADMLTSKETEKTTIRRSIGNIVDQLIEDAQGVGGGERS